MEVIKVKKRYTVPNMGALKGRYGRAIVETIRNTPQPDRTAIKQEVKNIRLHIMAERENGR